MSDFTAVKVGEGPPALPPCVWPCPQGTAHAATSCVLPETSGSNGIRLGAALAFQCKSSDLCPWLSDEWATSALQVRIAQWLQIPRRELQVAHFMPNARMEGIFIAREGEPG